MVRPSLAHIFNQSPVPGCPAIVKLLHVLRLLSVTTASCTAHFGPPCTVHPYTNHRITQGCCFSRSSGPNSPYPGGGPNSSARAINPPPLTLPEGVQSNPQSPPARRRRRDQGPLDQHINKPLRRHAWACRDRRWTKPQLARERADFFDTRVTGRVEVWQALHAALQVMWEPIAQDTEDEGLATAQTILSAAEISLPTGDLVNGVYDSLGNYYQLPEWVVSDPSDVTEGGDGGQDPKGELADVGDDTIAEDEDDVDDTEAESRRAEKGKAVVDAREQISVRARLSDNGRDVQVSVSKSENIRTVARKVAEASEVRCELP
jgi:hypothetical protein